jgi:hypothetical protein
MREGEKEENQLLSMLIHVPIFLRVKVNYAKNKKQKKN